MRLIAVAAGIELVTGVVVSADPPLVAWLLLGSGLPPVGLILGRVAGFALVGLGLACWPTRESNAAAPLRGLLAYNVLAALLFLYLGVRHDNVGLLLWPAFALHALLSVLLARDVSKTT